MKGKNVPVRDMCRSFGGDYDINTQTCNFPMDDPEQPRSAMDKDVIWFFVLQSIIGTASPIIVTFYRNVRMPTIWWTNFLILLVVTVLAFFMIYFKLRSYKESLSRTLVSLVIMYAFAILIGILHEGNALLYFDIIEFSKFPTSAVISGMVVSAFISYVLIPPKERKDENALNDFDEFQDVIVT